MMALLAQFVEAFVATGAAAMAVSLVLPPLMRSERRPPAKQRGAQR
jgi:hypothetical protein